MANVFWCSPVVHRSKLAAATAKWSLVLSNNVQTIAPTPTALTAFKAVVGPKGWQDAPDALSPWLTDWRGQYHGATALLLEPATTGEVVQIVKIANAHRVALALQGGNTGLVQGSTPDAQGSEILLSLRRLNQIRGVNPEDYSLVAEAGVVLAHAQVAAAQADRLLPLSLASEGSATIGGLISTNAGGVQVLRYGTMRALVLGLEVVLPSGDILHDLKNLRKDTMGYDVKQLFIGAEGSLGIITAACLKLAPKPQSIATAFVGLSTPDAALRLLTHLKSATGDQLTTFELIPRVGLELVLSHIKAARDPLACPHNWYALIEATSPAANADLHILLEHALQQALNLGLIEDAALSQNQAQAARFWHLRESLPEAERIDGGALKHDVSVAIAHMPAFIAAASQAVLALVPQARILAFGHLGDGNVHFNIRPPQGVAFDAFKAQAGSLSQHVFQVVQRFGGSIAAEHGVGRAKRQALADFADPTKLALMRTLKATLDPMGLLNPKRVV
jgi:FAD/FMN-containing dehydrogenase